eukprot:1282318-Amphidinium_carterae.1
METNGSLPAYQEVPCLEIGLLCTQTPHGALSILSLMEHFLGVPAAAAAPLYRTCASVCVCVSLSNLCKCVCVRVGDICHPRPVA